jgi:hypothetical protein
MRRASRIPHVSDAARINRMEQNSAPTGILHLHEDKRGAMKQSPRNSHFASRRLSICKVERQALLQKHSLLH